MRTFELSDGRPTASAAGDQSEHLATHVKDLAMTEAGAEQTVNRLQLPTLMLQYSPVQVDLCAEEDVSLSTTTTMHKATINASVGDMMDIKTTPGQTHADAQSRAPTAATITTTISPVAVTLTLDKAKPLPRTALALAHQVANDNPDQQVSQLSFLTPTHLAKERHVERDQPDEEEGEDEVEEEDGEEDMLTSRHRQRLITIGGISCTTLITGWCYVSI